MQQTREGFEVSIENRVMEHRHIVGKKRSWHLPWLDRIGAILAGICAVHCFLFMLGSIVLGFTASSLFFNPGLRWLMVLLVASMTVGSLFAHGRQNGKGPAWLMVGGLTAIIAANLLGIWAFAGEVLSLCGGLALATGHLIHLSRTRRALQPPITSKGHNLPAEIAFILLLITCVMASFQISSAVRIRPWDGESQAGKGTVVGWRVLSQLDVQSGEIGPDLQNVVGGQVRIPGFIVPLDESGRTFLLAPYAGACIHGPTPPMNQIIFVKMQARATPIDPWSWDPIWVTGNLQILEIQSPFGSVGFKMDGISTETYR